MIDALALLLAAAGGWLICWTGVQLADARERERTVTINHQQRIVIRNVPRPIDFGPVPTHWPPNEEG